MPADLQIALTGTDGLFLNSRYEKAGVRVREYEVQSGVLVDIGSALLAQYSPSWTPAGEGLALFIRQGNNVFCNEAGESPTQVSRGAWSRGEYEIRVGTVAAGGSVPYVLRVVEDR